MAKRFRFSIYALLASVVLVFGARPAAATPVTYTEKIEDLSFLTFLDLDFFRDLSRTRTFGDGSTQTETDDTTIASENVLTSNWGFGTIDIFSWTHLFFLDPPAASYLQGTLTLEVIGVDGTIGDIVFVEGFPIGVLTPGATDVQSSSLFSTSGLPDPNGLISFFLTDNRLDVAVWPLFFDLMSIRSSTVEVTYQPVPEPTTAVLLMSGLAAAGWRRHRRRRSQ